MDVELGSVTEPNMAACPPRRIQSGSSTKTFSNEIRYLNQQISDIESEKTNLKSHLEKIREDPERAMPVVVELISLERKLRELSNKVLQLQYESSEKDDCPLGQRKRTKSDCETASQKQGAMNALQKAIANLAMEDIVISNTQGKDTHQKINSSHRAIMEPFNLFQDSSSTVQGKSSIATFQTFLPNANFKTKHTEPLTQETPSALYCTPEGRGGEKGGSVNTKTKHTGQNIFYRCT